MFHYIDLNNIQQYIDDTGNSDIGVVDVRGDINNAEGTTYNFASKKPGNFVISIGPDDTYKIAFSKKDAYKLRYDEDRKCSMERL